MKNITKEVLLELFNKKNLSLKPTQPSLFVPTIDRMYKKLKNGVSFAPIKVVDNIIIEGHHRYVASILANVKFDEIPSHRTSATQTKSWESMNFEETEDFYSQEEIELFNKIDAKSCHLPFEEFIQLISKS